MKVPADGPGLWRPGLAERIEAVPADLAAPHLGLSPERYDVLARLADAVYHCGAAVNLAHSYAQLKAVNVDATTALLRLAARHRSVALHHVSTVGVLAPEPDGDRLVHPDAGLPGPERLRHGYAQSKWVAEVLVAQAAARGLPVTVHRPPGSWRTPRPASASPPTTSGCCWAPAPRSGRRRPWTGPPSTSYRSTTSARRWWRSPAAPTPSAAPSTSPPTPSCS
ncbi:SDR family oxidoreductase [Streptomyces sp. NPDC048387]|uniref:SDR family oxidoreductase n=1 Tax=Streptomyces sp. NPDC048387 TaxID=3365542 RepID=UPI00371D486A